jgi:outer membrane receptor protein involved in Fe transport
LRSIPAASSSPATSATRAAGFDLQLDLKVSEQFSLQAEVGYTDAKFLNTFLGGPSATVPSVTKGNHIASPPWTVSVHGQYDIPLGENKAYVRTDFDYRAYQSALTPGIDPRNGGSIQRCPTHRP